MTITMQQVRAQLDRDEPDYRQAAQALGPDALPHLEQIIRKGDAESASRAVYLASLFVHERASALVAMGMERPEATLHVTVAAAARNLVPQLRATMLLRLLDEDDVGVRKFALRAVPEQPESALVAKVERLARNEPQPALRRLAGEVLERTLR
jgi:hypothetical protein